MSGRRVCEINVYVNILVTRANGCGVEGQWYVGVSGRVIGMWGPWYVQSVICGGLVVCWVQWYVEESGKIDSNNQNGKLGSKRCFVTEMQVIEIQ